MFKDNYGRFLINILISTGIGILIVFVLLLIMSLFALLLDLSEGVLSPLSTVALAIGTYFSAYISGKVIKEKSLFIGLIIGFLIFIIISIVSAIVSKSSLTLISLFHFLVTVLSGVIGAIIGVNSANKRKIIWENFI